MKAVLIVGSIFAASFGWMGWFARFAAKRDPIDPEALKKTSFPRGGGH